jgi:hypothetical protein
MMKRSGVDEHDATGTPSYISEPKARKKNCSE